MKIVRNRIRIGLLIVVITVLAVAYWISTFPIVRWWWSSGPVSVAVFEQESDLPLVEEKAVLIAREALVQAGVSSSNMKPVPYDGEKQLYARNRETGLSGYVLWQIHRRDEWDYSVNIEQRGRTIRAEVYAADQVDKRRFEPQQR